jgi:hypothetical protein
MHEQFKKRLKELINQIIKNELKELTTTGDVDGYSTPFAFDDTNEPGSNCFKCLTRYLAKTKRMGLGRKNYE